MPPSFFGDRIVSFNPPLVTKLGQLAVRSTDLSSALTVLVRRAERTSARIRRADKRMGRAAEVVPGRSHVSALMN